MASDTHSMKSGQRFPVFPVACWSLALMAASQLIVAGMALATRFEEGKQVRIIEKAVIKPVVVRVPDAAAPDRAATIPDAPIVSHPPLPTPAFTPAEPSPPPTPTNTPRIADPRAERLVNEARTARIAGDMGHAVMALEEALTHAPDEPNVHYELGLVHEQMGVYDTAAAHYEQVFRMGITTAGSLYEMAAAKLRDGFETDQAMHGKLALGRVQIYQNPNHRDGQRVILTIPVEKSPGEDIEIDNLSVSVVFFNKTSRGEIIQLEDNSWVSENWVSLPFDWAAGQETLRMTYTIPHQDAQTSHLFGQKQYYGQVVSLHYGQEVLDVQAWPRDLAARMPRPATPGPGELMLPEFQDSLPPDFDPDLPLLPTLPE